MSFSIIDRPLADVSSSHPGEGPGRDSRTLLIGDSGKAKNPKKISWCEFWNFALPVESKAGRSPDGLTLLHAKSKSVVQLRWNKGLWAWEFIVLEGDMYGVHELSHLFCQWVGNGFDPYVVSVEI